MHTRDLYQVTDIPKSLFQELIEHLITAAGLPKTPAVYHKVASKCQDLVNASANTWQEDGVLVKQSTRWKKSPEFQGVWDSAVELISTATPSPEQTPSASDSEDRSQMSRSSSVSTTRRLSDESGALKRPADEATLFRQANSRKRARHNGSCAQNENEDIDASRVVSSSRPTEKDDLRQKQKQLEGRHDLIPPFEGSRVTSLPDSSSPGLAATDRGAEKVVCAKDFTMHYVESEAHDVVTNSSPTAIDVPESQPDISPCDRASLHMSPTSSLATHAENSTISLPTSASGYPICSDSSITIRAPVISPHFKVKALEDKIPSILLSSSEHQARSPLSSQKLEKYTSPPMSIADERLLPRENTIGIDKPSSTHVINSPDTRQNQPEAAMLGSSGLRPVRNACCRQVKDPSNTNSAVNSSSRPESWPSPELPAWLIEENNALQSRPAAVNPCTDDLPKANVTPFDEKSITTSSSREHSKGLYRAPFSSIPSEFTDPTTDLVQHNEASDSTVPKLRGRKLLSGANERYKSALASSMPVLPAKASPAENGGIPVHHANSHHEIPSEIPSANHSHHSIQSSISNGPPYVHRTLPLGDSYTPLPELSHPQNYRPPSLVFTIDNRAESPLLTADVQRFIEKFTKVSRVMIPAIANGVHPIGVIMWQSMQDFYKWYSDVTGSSLIRSLRFELTDVHWQEEKSFVVPDGKLNHFRMLKQYIWDLYWVASHLDVALELFRVFITPYPLPSESIGDGSPQTRPWNAVGARASNVPTGNTPATNLENIMVVADSQNMPSMAPWKQRLTHPLVRSSDSFVISRNDVMHQHVQDQVRAQVPSPRIPGNTRQSLQPYLPRSPGNISFDQATALSKNYIEPVPAQISVNSSTRTKWDKAMLRDRAHAFLIGRNELELLVEESTTGDKLPYKLGSEVCGAIIDRKSGTGRITITGKGFYTQNFTTGPAETGERYQEVAIQPKQTCMLHEEAVVLYYRKRKADPSIAIMPAPVPQSHQLGSPTSWAQTSSNPPQLHPREFCHSQSQSPHLQHSISPVDISIRIQVDSAGRCSKPFGKQFLRPKITTTEFFSWFASQNGHGSPAGPSYLRFTLKDSMPIPKSTEITRGNEDHFNYLRKDIKAEFEKAKAYMPEMKEFGVLVTDPAWRQGQVEEDEDW